MGTCKAEFGTAPPVRSGKEKTSAHPVDAQTLVKDEGSKTLHYGRCSAKAC